MNRRPLIGLALALLVSFPTTSDSRLFGRGGSASGGGGGGSVNLSADFIVTNNTGSTVANGYRRFWHPFTQGDIPAGTAPIFKNGSGVALPYSAGAQVYWPGDGSLMGAMFQVCKIPSTANGASQTISVWSGGTFPSASARSLTEVYNQQITTTLTSASIAGANMSGFASVGAWIVAPGSDTNHAGTFKTMSGGCGEEWYRESDMSVTLGSAAHGQLVHGEYVMALDDGSGNAAGFTRLGKDTQPWYNIDSPAKNVRAFSSASWSINPGGGGVITQPYAPLPAPDTFTSTASSQTFTVAAVSSKNPFYFGAEDFQHLAGAVTGTSGVDATKLYAITSYSAANLNTNIGTYLYATAGLATATNTASGTFTPLYVVPHFGSLIDATPKATSWYFQGTGSIAADPRLDFKPNKTYWARTKTLVIPPNMSETTVTTSTYAYPWNQASIGTTRSDRANGGYPDYGWLAPFAMRWFMVQGTNDETLVRIFGLSAALEGGNFRDHATRQFANLTNKNYAGGTFPIPALSTDQKGIQLPCGNPCTSTYLNPPAESYRYAWSLNDCSHCIENATIAYQVSGEAYMLDLINENAFVAVAHYSPDNHHRNPSFPVQRYAITTSYGQHRDQAHSSRRVIQAAAFTPATYFDGSARKAMWTDIQTDSWNHLSGLLAANNSYAKSIGFDMMIIYNDDGSLLVTTIDIPWQVEFIATSGVGGYILLGNTAAKTFAQNLVTRYTHYFALYGGWPLAVDTSSSVTNANISGNTEATDGVPISSDLGWAPRSGSTGADVTWTNSSPAFSITTVATTGWTPSLNDRMFWYKLFETPTMTGGFYTAPTSYYLRDVVNTSGLTYTFNLAATPNGAAISPPTNTGAFHSNDWASTWIMPLTTSVTPTSSQSGTGSSGYSAKQRCVEMLISANGILALDNVTSIAGPLADVNNRVGGADWNQNPAFDCQATYP